MNMKLFVAVALLVQSSSALVAHVRPATPALRPASVRSALRPVLVRMEEAEPPAEEAAPVAAEAVTPPPAPAPPADEGGFDPTQYSLTIGIAVLFVIVKSLSYFGIIDT